MQKEAVFTMQLEPELREELMAEAAATHRPASQIVHESDRIVYEINGETIWILALVNTSRQWPRAS